MNTLKNHINTIALYIELTSLCNLNCPYCYNDSGCKSSSLQYDLLVNRIDELIGNYNCTVSLSGGEPLLYERMDDLLLFLKSKQIMTSIATNGTLVDRRFVNFVTQNNILLSHVQISMDGSTNVIDSYSRGQNHFQQAISAIHLLNDTGIKVNINFVITRHNYLDIENMIQFAIDVGVSRINFSFLNILGRAEENKSLDILAGEKECVINQLRSIKAQYAKEIELNIPEINYSKCPLINPKNKYLSPRIDSECNVYICHMFVGKDYSLGNIYDSSIEEAINGKMYTAFVDKIKWHTQQRNQHCNACLIEKYCSGLCPALYIMGTYDYLNQMDGLCNTRKMQLLNCILDYKNNSFGIDTKCIIN